LTGIHGGGTRASDAELTLNQRRDTLAVRGATSFFRGLTEPQFAEILAGPRPREDDADALAHWKAEVDRARISLKNAHGKPSYKGVLCDKRLPAGSDTEQWRWFIVKPDPSDAIAGLRLTAPMDPATLFGHTTMGVRCVSLLGLRLQATPLRGRGSLAWRR
jgi:hypothetical protein